MVEGIQSLPSPQIPISRGCYFQNCAQRNCGLSQQPKLWAVKHCLNAINFILSHPYLWGNLQNSSAPTLVFTDYWRTLYCIWNLFWPFIDPHHQSTSRSANLPYGKDYSPCPNCHLSASLRVSCKFSC